jgi:hypothetical protein
MAREALACAAVVTVLAGLVAGAGSAAKPPGRVALAPNAIAFHDARHGLMGTGWLGCESSQFGCKLQGTISKTADGGRTWRIVHRSARPVVSVSVESERAAWARYDDGENLRSTDGWNGWHPAVGPNPVSTPCFAGAYVSVGVTTPSGRAWALCTGQPGAGNESKDVYRLGSGGWKRIAWAPLIGKGGEGGLASYGYPVGMAMADDGFGIIWESRGTLYVTRDGGYHWVGEPHVARPDLDFGVSGSVVKGGTGYVVLSQGGRMIRRLLVTHDAGRHWRVAHRWK